MIRNKKIILAVTGSIALYKSCFLLRLLKKEGAEVKVLMTPASQEFVTPLTFSVLSEEKIYDRYTTENHWNEHVTLALWADLFVAAPLSANTLAKMANGLCDNFWMAVYLSLRCPVFFAPAMDSDMYQHPATQKNLATVKLFDQHFFLPPEEGFLASGLSGIGRMMEPEQIFQKIQEFFT